MPSGRLQEGLLPRLQQLAGPFDDGVYAFALVCFVHVDVNVGVDAELNLFHLRIQVRTGRETHRPAVGQLRRASTCGPSAKKARR